MPRSIYLTFLLQRSFFSLFCLLRPSTAPTFLPSNAKLRSHRCSKPRWRTKERASSMTKPILLQGENNQKKNSHRSTRGSAAKQISVSRKCMRERQTDTQTHTEKEANQTLALEVLSSLRFSVGCCMWCRSCGGRGGCGRNFQKKWNCFASGSLKVLLLCCSLAR